MFDVKEGGMGRNRSWWGAAVVVAFGFAVTPVAAASSGTTFVSKSYGYSLTVPGAAKYWTSTYAIVAWSAGSLEPGGPAFDTFIDSRANRRYIIAARRLTDGETLMSWTTYFASRQALDCRGKPSRPSVLSDTPARVFFYACPDGIKGFAVTAIHAGRGYFMVVSSYGGTSADRTAFEIARHGFRFRRS
jgi:hypothetical protein